MPIKDLELGLSGLAVAGVEVGPRPGACNALAELQVLPHLDSEDGQVRLQAHQRNGSRRIASRCAARLGEAVAFAKLPEDLMTSVEESVAAVRVGDELDVSQEVRREIVRKEYLHLWAVRSRSTQYAHPRQVKQLHRVCSRYTVADPLEKVRYAPVEIATGACRCFRMACVVPVPARNRRAGRKAPLLLKEPDRCCRVNGHARHGPFLHLPVDFRVIRLDVRPAHSRQEGHLEPLFQRPLMKMKWWRGDKVKKITQNKTRKSRRYRSRGSREKKSPTRRGRRENGARSTNRKNQTNRSPVTWRQRDELTATSSTQAALSSSVMSVSSSSSSRSFSFSIVVMASSFSFMSSSL